MTAATHAPVRPELWRIDPLRSTVGFAVRHLGISTVRGSFGSFDGRIRLLEDGFTAQGQVDVASVESGNAVRDARLRSEFFDVQAFPSMTFAGRGRDDLVIGELTVHGVTQPVVFAATTTLRDGELHIHAEADLSRADFGLDWEALREAGRLLVSDRVRMTLTLVACAEDDQR